MPTKAPGVRLLAVCSLALLVAACTNPEEKKARHFDKGKALASEGKYADAVIEFRNAIKVDPRFGEARFELAKAFDQTGNTQAVREYLRAADLLPARGDVQEKAAALMIRSRQFELARKHADLALKANPDSVDAHVLRAYSLAGLKDKDGAMEELEQAMTAAPDDYRPYATVGAIESGIGNPVEAEAAFKKAIQMAPSAVPPRLALAYFYWSVRRIADTERALKDVLAAAPDNIEANRLLALLYMTSGRPQDAETPLQRLAEARDPRSTLTLGDLYVATGRAEKARPLYETLTGDRALADGVVLRLAALDYAAGRRTEAHAAVDAQLKKAPRSVALLSQKVQWFIAEGEKDEALRTAKDAVAAESGSAQAQYFLARAMVANRMYAEATQTYREVLRLNPGVTAAHIEISQLLLAAGQPDQALEQARAARKAAPGNPEARFSVARALLRKGDSYGAEAELKALRAQFPEVAAVHALTGQVLLARSDAAGAAKSFDRALTLDPTHVEALSGRAAIDVAQKRSADARSRFHRAIASAPANSDILIAAAGFERINGDPAAAEAHLRKAMEIDAANLEVYNQLAQLYIGQRRLDDGKRELEELVRRRPSAVGARTMLGMIHHIQGQLDEAAKTYEAVLQQSSTAAVAANNLAYLYAERGEQLDRALHLAQTAKQQLPQHPVVNDTLGWVYYKKGMAELAVKSLEASVAADAKNPVYLVHLGLAYAKAGKTAKARSMLSEALKLNADVEGAVQARAVLASLQN